MDINKINITTFSRALEKRQQRENLHILIVEDQKFSRLMLKTFLAKAYEVTDVETGEDALAEYIISAPDIVFLDIELPKVNGYKVLKLLTKLDKKAFIIMVTANNYKEDVDKSLTLGAKGFVAKPYTKDKIYECVEDFILMQQ